MNNLRGFFVCLSTIQGTVLVFQKFLFLLLASLSLWRFELCLIVLNKE